jgi:hypothetical protein
VPDTPERNGAILRQAQGRTEQRRGSRVPGAGGAATSGSGNARALRRERIARGGRRQGRSVLDTPERNRARVSGAGVGPRASKK